MIQASSLVFPAVSTKREADRAREVCYLTSAPNRAWNVKTEALGDNMRHVEEFLLRKWLVSMRAASWRVSRS